MQVHSRPCVHGGSLLHGFSVYELHPLKSPNASRLNFATCSEVSQIWIWTSKIWGTGFLPPRETCSPVAQKLVLRHRDLSVNIFGIIRAAWEVEKTFKLIWWLSKIITATQRSLTHICSEAYSKQRNLRRLIWTTKQRSLCRTELNSESLTVETVVVVVEVAVIALFTEVRVHNTVTTPTHLNTKSLRPHTTKSPNILICVCKLTYSLLFCRGLQINSA